jgi:beta-N-acetylhexosaminidase
VTRPGDVVARRRRRALAAVALAAALAGAFAGSRADDDDDDAESPSAPVAAKPACPAAVASSPRRLVGQMLVARMEDRVTDGLRQAARAGELGGVILFPSPDAAPRVLASEVERLRSAAAAGGAPAPLVMIDQEGGEVKRLPGLPPELAPSALAGEGELAAVEEGEATGRALARVGIDVNLAPVLDLGGTPGGFMAPRTFGDEPGEVARLGAGFAEGLQREGVAATAKHFPGLGLATVSTDEAPSTVAGSKADLQPGLEPFRAAAVDPPVELVMTSNAVYPAYDEARPASLSHRVTSGLLRRDLGYEGVVITDDLGAGALTGAGIDEGEAAVAAARAGADLLLFALSDGSAARDALLRALRRGALRTQPLVESCARVTSLRAG